VRAIFDMKPSEIKIACIGGGSRYWARVLLTELALAPQLAGRLDLYDINLAAARRNVAVAEAIFARPEAKTRFRVRAVSRLKEALLDADFVMISIEPGPIEMRHADIAIPARHGILHPCGDSAGPAGTMRALRTIPLYEEFARAIAAHCPKAWVFNYSNPMTLCTAALHAVSSDIKAFGCCHEVFSSQHRLAELVAKWFGVPTPPRSEIAIDLTGLNHFTWVTGASWKGHDLMPRLLAEIAEPGFFRSRVTDARRRKRNELWFESSGMVGLDLLRRFGALGFAGDRHLVEYVPWYARSEGELHRWGTVVTPLSWRLRRAKLVDHAPSHYAEHPLHATDEDVARIIEALLGHAPLDTNVNLPNRGQAPDLPVGHVVETNAQFRRDSVTPVVSRSLPAGARALVRHAADVQQLVLQAALKRDVDMAFQAILADPLVHVGTDEAWKMFTAMLHHTREMLPGYRLPAVA
jgi:alpha-galactosidase/6-phospho-beta-glucosidase family protein